MVMTTSNQHILGSPFKPVRTGLAEQSYKGALFAKVVRDGREVNPPDERAYTVRKIECTSCGAVGDVKDYHGTNCFWECSECNAGLKI